MDIATSSISNMVMANIPHAAQEARRDSIARETIPQVSHLSKGLNSQTTAHGNAQLAPANSNLYIQADNLIRSEQIQKKSQKKTERENKKDQISTENNSSSQSVKASSSASTATVSSNTLNNGVEKISSVQAALDGAYGNTGASYSVDADNKREKESGYSSKVIASTYNAIIPDTSKGQTIDVTG